MIDKQLVKDYIGIEQNLVSTLKELKAKQILFEKENKELLDLILTYKTYLLENKEKIKSHLNFITMIGMYLIMIY